MSLERRARKDSNENFVLMVGVALEFRITRATGCFSVLHGVSFLGYEAWLGWSHGFNGPSFVVTIFGIWSLFMGWFLLRTRSCIQRVGCVLEEAGVHLSPRSRDEVLTRLDEFRNGTY